ncbi:response regulator of zinc sigma-54-dependent two-component system [Desulfocucumis palustris]|uniref:Response regulator of zinc sigma-54-dependent two-component system n=1 Tax=Desulfocucumis palustris TaxID=1898651 RepID=A0A2L2XFK7_9FIRM|nr:sigma 54-interacting transcriptional regulator [Desulfocucumis palustris]GBF32641.1 response regulator of zinc sigma-54-dependent two-component system [Desulfocucumis palustris]
MSILAGVQEICQKVAEAVASVLKVEVEIIDNELVRVAGTGSVRNDVGFRLRRGFVNKHVLGTGQPVSINEPGYHDICVRCPLTGNCFYRSSIVYPIHAETAVIGTISLIAFDAQQKENLKRNENSLMEFIGRMADLIGSKALEREIISEKMLMAGRLEAVVDAAYEALVAIDRAGVVTHFNRSAERLFRLTKEGAIGRHIQFVLSGINLEEVLEGDKAFNSREVFVKCGSKRLHLLATARIIKGEGGASLGVVASFRDFSETQKIAYQYISSQREITFDDIIGESKLIMEVKNQARKVAASNSTVLILGETGTGKEIFARAIHAASPFADKPFVALNCGAIPESLLESELFGYDEGAFTGARRGGKPGKFELANGGTIFLDEIGNMSLYLQAKLLRVLQEKQIERVGGTQLISVEVRIIAATNNDLMSMVEKGLFREDLYYRVSVIPIVLPALREREGDIPVLLDHYIKRFSGLLNKDIKGLSGEALHFCRNYNWPGNIRELINVVEYSVNLEEGDYITPDSLPRRLRDKNMQNGIKVSAGADIVPLETLEREAVLNSLKKYGWTDEGKRRAAGALGISRATIYRKIEKYGLEPPGGLKDI